MDSSNKIKVGDRVYCESKIDAWRYSDTPGESGPGFHTLRFNGIVEEIAGGLLRLDHDCIIVNRKNVVKVFRGDIPITDQIIPQVAA